MTRFDFSAEASNCAARPLGFTPGVLSFGIFAVFGSVLLCSGPLLNAEPKASSTAQTTISQANPETEETEEHNRALIRSTRELRARFQSDLHRPTYHFVAPEGDCHAFDPNGAIFWKGRYHLFYIFQPGPFKGQPYGFKGSWGHASSVDLLHWRIHPTALQPGEGDPVINSGAAYLSREGVPTLIYSRGNGVCLATSTDDELEHWPKHPNNPVQLPGGDVHGWLENDTYYALIGTKLHRSSDQLRWEFLHGLLKSDRPLPHVGEDVSCPDFFALRDRHIFMFMSHTSGVQYYIGRYQRGLLHVERHGRMNWKGGTLIAPESLIDGRGRRVSWAWACEARNAAAQRAAGWSGVFTLPRILDLDADGALQVEPAEELARLRLNPRQGQQVSVPPDTEMSLPGVRGNTLELNLDWQPGQASSLGIKLLASPGGEEHTLITFDLGAKSVCIDVSGSSLSPDVFYPWPHPWSAHHPMGGPWNKEAVHEQTAPLDLREGETLKLRLFLDRSVLELYINGRQCMTQRIYPTRADSLGLTLFSKGGDAQVLSWSAWDMAASNPW